MSKVGRFVVDPKAGAHCQIKYVKDCASVAEVQQRCKALLARIELQ